MTIRTIQANKPSTYATQTVTTSGIVVGVKSNGFYLEAKNADTTPVTPEGILVYTGIDRAAFVHADWQRGAGDGHGGHVIRRPG